MFLNVTTPVNCASTFSSYVTMISNFFMVIFNEFFTNPRRVTWLKLLFVFSHDQIFVEIFFHDFFTIFRLHKNCFKKFKSSIFTSVNNYRLTKFIINTNKFVSKTVSNVILIFFEYNLHSKSVKNLKCNWYLFKIVFKFCFSFSNLMDCAPLMLKQTSLCSVKTFLLLKRF